MTAGSPSPVAIVCDHEDAKIMAISAGRISVVCRPAFAGEVELRTSQAPPPGTVAYILLEISPDGRTAARHLFFAAPFIDRSEGHLSAILETIKAVPSDGADMAKISADEISLRTMNAEGSA